MPTALGILYTDRGVEGTHRQMLEDSLWVQDIVAHLLGHELDWRPGARELLEAVRSPQLPSALVTTTPRRVAAGLLRRMDADLGLPVFDVTVWGLEVPTNKSATARAGGCPEFRRTSVAARCPSGCDDLLILHGGADSSGDLVSSATRSLGRCRWPLTRRNCLPGSIMPAAHQRSAIRPSRQRLTLEEWCRRAR